MKSTNQEREAMGHEDEPVTRKELAALFQSMSTLVTRQGIDQSLKKHDVMTTRELPDVHQIEDGQLSERADLKPEFIRIGDAVKLFGIGRGKLYEMMGSGEIKSVSLRKRGTMRGIRLIPYDHLKAYLDSLLE